MRHFIKFKKLSNITNKIKLPEKQMNQSYAILNTLRLRLRVRKVVGVQL